MADGATLTIIPEPTGAEKPATVVADPNRPAWLPEKFKTAEDFAASYKELESKVGVKDVPVTPVTVTEALKAKGLNLSDLEADYLANGGKLSDAKMTELTAAGFTAEQANQYIKGQEAIATQNSKEVFDSVGGKARFDALQGFAATTFTDSERAAYNAAVTKGDYASVKLMLAGLNSTFEKTYGSDGKLLSGGSPTVTQDIYENFQAFRTAQGDKRYQKDSNYRAAVDAKLARSKFWST